MSRNHYQTIVIAVDFSPATDVVLQRGLDLAARLGARAEVVYVTPALEPALPFHRTNRRAVEKLQKEELERAREALAERIAEYDSAVGTAVRVGPAHEQILAHAKEHRAGIIVIGKRGQNLAESLLIGSTADRVVRKATVPVFVVTTPRKPR